MRFLYFSVNLGKLCWIAEKISKLKSEKDGSICIAFKYFFKDDEIESLRKLKISKLLVLTNILLMKYDVEGFCNALAACYKKYPADLIVLGNEIEDKEIAARLSAKLGIPALIDCIDFKVEGNKIIADRNYECSLAVATYEVNLPAIITLANASSISITPSEKEAIKEEINIPVTISRVLIRDEKELSDRYEILKQAKFLLWVGEDIHDEEELGEIREIAGMLNGELVGDKTAFARGWFKEWLGFSGLNANSKKILSLGVKGDLDQIGGLSGAEQIICISEDPYALILNYSDYFVVGDLHKILKALKKRLKKRIR